MYQLYRVSCLLIAPNPPNGLQVVVVNKTLKLIWTLPAVNIFIANSYKISYTWNDWNDKYDILVNADESSCNIPNILPEKIYKFIIASCLQDLYEGKPSLEILYCSGCKFDEIVCVYAYCVSCLMKARFALSDSAFTTMTR